MDERYMRELAVEAVRYLGQPFWQDEIQRQFTLGKEREEGWMVKSFTPDAAQWQDLFRALRVVKMAYEAGLVAGTKKAK